MDIDQLCDEILAAHADTDNRVRAFADVTRLSCPPGCGACCETPDIEATELEMLPMARFLYDSNSGLPDPLRPGGCALYVQTGPGRGRCSAYKYRPAACGASNRDVRRQRVAGAALR